ncbi:hypothetical protein PH586_11845 [Pseudomonas sp. SA3-5]|uniref:pEK499-p136 HEPN domain-containing protein n=1 Tax=Pseudomonas aestuarii TaxID=3018340 RepID=A0ABT4XFS6_9PSED|nr:hypothetical protein [Pseudomonas aestuarii]MDA7087078.1 hypothetical protein [Pseudomonas aestuarii]
MEYFRERDNRIQADFALHAGKLLVQYCEISSGSKLECKYDATLTICIFQSILTNCDELLMAMSRAQKRIWDEEIVDIPNRWGIKRNFIVKNTFIENKTYRNFLTHLRNALSHPTSPDRSPHYESSGYTTLSDSSGVISKFLFIDSPWVRRGKLKRDVSSEIEMDVKEALGKLPEKMKSILRVAKSQNGNYEIYRKDRVYYPAFKAEITLPDLVNAVLELANFLAQPVRDDWDGRTVSRLIG